MRTLSDLKRRMTVGTVVDTINHRYPDMSGARTVLKVQGHRWCLSLPTGHPRYDEVPDGSWMDIPPAGRCTSTGNTVVIHRDPAWNDNGPFVTLTFRD